MYKIQPNSSIVGKNVVYLPTCHSTNDIARELIHLTPPAEGTVVISGAQTAGKGLRGNTWSVEPHANLTFSVILCPTWLTPEKAFDLTLGMSLGVIDALQTLGFSTSQIKWPNDLYLGSGKLGGMLIEPAWSGPSCSSCIVGIGLNVNQLAWEWPRATSLAKESGRHWDLEDVLATVLISLDRMYLRMPNPNFRTTALAQYYACLLGYRQRRRYRVAGQDWFATAEEVDPWGRLVLVDEAGKRRSFDLKEVEFCWD